MKTIILACTILTAIASCKKKNDHPVITGTVQQQGGCAPNTWLVFIPNSGAEQYSFLCNTSAPTSSFNCSNSVYIINMPASLSQLGKRIKFSRWTDSGGSCSSSSFAPHHLNVSDLSEE